MTLGELREYLTTCTDMADDKLEILVPSGDHSYRICDIEIQDVEKCKAGYFEYFDKANLYNGGKKARALVVS